MTCTHGLPRSACAWKKFPEELVVPICSWRPTWTISLIGSSRVRSSIAWPMAYSFEAERTSSTKPISTHSEVVEALEDRASRATCIRAVRRNMAIARRSREDDLPNQQRLRGFQGRVREFVALLRKRKKFPARTSVVFRLRPSRFLAPDSTLIKCGCEGTSLLRDGAISATLSISTIWLRRMSTRP